MARIGVVGVLILVLALGLTCVGWAADGTSIRIETEGVGTAVIGLPALVLAGTLSGDLTQSGAIDEADGSTGFWTRGTFDGTGYRELLTFEAEAWIMYHSEGIASDAGWIAIDGVLYLYRESLTLLRVGDALEGAHYCVVTIDGTTQQFVGRFTGSLTDGGPTVTEPGALLTLMGVGEFTFTGTALDPLDPVCLSIPLPADEWLHSLAVRLLETFPSVAWAEP